MRAAILRGSAIVLYLCHRDALAFSTSIWSAPVIKAPFQSKSKNATPKCRFVSLQTSSASSSDDAEVSLSRRESIIANAKSFLPPDFDERKKTLFSATLSGLAVSLAMIPEAVAFSFVANVSPLVGLWTTVILGFFAAAFGSGAGLVSSASGACSVVVASLGRSHGNVYVSASALLAGIFQAAGGALGLGRLIRLIPHPCMLGFVNGLAVVMTKAQLHHFRVDGDAFMSIRTAAGASMYGLTALTMVLVKLMPKITKVIPPTLGAVILSTIISKYLKLPVQTLADVVGADAFAGGLSGLPKLALPAVAPSEMFTTILPFAATMAAVGCIESLLTLQIVDGMVDDGKRGSTKAECVGQGVGNMMSGLTGGIGGCALLGQSIINVQSGGGGSRWSGMSMALFLAAGIVYGAPLLATVPVASLVGIMLLVCQATFSWSSLRLIRKIPRLDAAVIALVSILTVERDLAQAVVAGTLLERGRICLETVDSAERKLSNSQQWCEAISVEWTALFRYLKTILDAL
jgi:SulP family sulfate permease